MKLVYIGRFAASDPVGSFVDLMGPEVNTEDEEEGGFEVKITHHDVFIVPYASKALVTLPGTTVPMTVDTTMFAVFEVQGP